MNSSPPVEAARTVIETNKKERPECPFIEKTGGDPDFVLDGFPLGYNLKREIYCGGPKERPTVCQSCPFYLIYQSR